MHVRPIRPPSRSARCSCAFPFHAYSPFPQNQYIGTDKTQLLTLSPLMFFSSFRTLVVFSRQGFGSRLRVGIRLRRRGTGGGYRRGVSRYRVDVAGSPAFSMNFACIFFLSFSNRVLFVFWALSRRDVTIHHTQR